MGENVVRISETRNVVKSFKKCGISNALDGTQDDDVLFEESEGSDSNKDSDSSNEDFKGFYDQ
jgi:hypothetical protein